MTNKSNLALADSSDGSSRKATLGDVITISDFERAAEELLKPEVFATLRTGAEDERTLTWNRASWKALRFRPRVLRPVTSVDTSCTILGSRFSLPLFASPAGGERLFDPEGKLRVTRVTGQSSMLHWVCNNGGSKKEDVAAIRAANQTQFWQVYIRQDLDFSAKEIREAAALGYKGIAITVDALWPGKRVRDIKAQLLHKVAGSSNYESHDDQSYRKVGILTRPPLYAQFDWEKLITWVRDLTDLPIAIKGVQCWEDAMLCMEHGVHPYLSNHGGRQMDGAPSALDTLLEIRQHCPRVFTKCDVIVDGGIESGSDIVKAIALGAKAIGIGRPILYAMATFGEEGIQRVFGILEHELKTAMALLGVSELSQLNPSHVDASGINIAGMIVRSRI